MGSVICTSRALRRGSPFVFRGSARPPPQTVTSRGQRGLSKWWQVTAAAPGSAWAGPARELTIPLERDVPPPSPELTYLLTYRVDLPYVVHLH